MEISKTNGESELSYPLSWVQAFPLFQDISSKESSFVHYYCASTCSFPVAADTETRRKSLSQVSIWLTQLTEGREVEIVLLFKNAVLLKGYKNINEFPVSKLESFFSRISCNRMRWYPKDSIDISGSVLKQIWSESLNEL